MTRPTAPADAELIAAQEQALKREQAAQERAGVLQSKQKKKKTIRR
ncbi:hypothetical protein [Halomonas sp. WWR20]